MIEWMQASVMTYKLPVYCSQHWLWHTHIYITEQLKGSKFFQTKKQIEPFAFPPESVSQVSQITNDYQNNG